MTGPNAPGFGRLLDPLAIPRSTVLTTRYVYFSFHYARDIFRVQQVKNHWVAKGNYSAAGYFDGSLEEKAKKESDRAVKMAINRGMVGSTVTCVLIGAKTSARQWVAYEIFRSVERGMGIFGVRIHNLKVPRLGTDVFGDLPFINLVYAPHRNSDKLWPYAQYANGWQQFTLAEGVAPSVSQYLRPRVENHLDGKFRIYDWVKDDGYNNFPLWADAAAKEAGR
jgi:hypothetical protein